MQLQQAEIPGPEVPGGGFSTQFPWLGMEDGEESCISLQNASQPQLAWSICIQTTSMGMLISGNCARNSQLISSEIALAKR